MKKQPLLNINLTGYFFVNVDPVGNAGGVAMYVRKDLKITQEQNIHLHGCESLWLTLYQLTTNKKLTIATIYSRVSQTFCSSVPFGHYSRFACTPKFCDVSLKKKGFRLKSATNFTLIHAQNQGDL